MKMFKNYGCVMAGLTAFTLMAAPLPSAWAAAPADEKFDVLNIGTRSYTNVTVTTKSAQYIFILHSTGMANIKIADVPAEARQKLGYNTSPAKSETSMSSKWAKEKLSQLQLPNMTQLEPMWRQYAPGSLATITFTPQLIRTVLGIALLCYLFFCYCGRLICCKTGNPPGLLIWIPLLQLFPLLRAARMSPGWFLAFLVPGLNVIAQIIWCVKIAKARGKSGFVAFLLVLPITSLLAFLYLAFSSLASSEEKETRRPANAAHAHFVLEVA
jgi:hypothetical protein